ncbi:MAG: hypothetical protein R3E97_05645 [Candidatus Eisenbacteria bacterium]
MRRLLTLPRSARILPAALVLFGTSALLFSAGCSDSNDPTTSPDPTNQEEEAIPTISDVQNEVALTAEQAAEVERALNQWRIESRRSENMEDVLLEDSPAVAFLARSAQSLNEAQMVALREMAGRVEGARAEEFRPEPGDRAASLIPGIRGLFHGLDLSREQVIAIRDALAAAREDVFDLCEQYRDGLLSEEEMIAARAEVRVELQAAIANILTEEQNAALEQNKLNILARRLDHLLQRFDQRTEMRVGHLDALLDLSDEQEVAITAVIEAAKPSIVALLESIEAGNLTSAEAWEEFRSIQEETAAGVRLELTEDQIGILDELREMHEPCRGNVEL